jgi:uncharacterized membrane protein
VTAHLYIIHFPVSLILVAAALDLIGVAMNDRALRDWAGRFLLVGSIAAFLSFLTGEGAKLAAIGDAGVRFDQLELHQQWGSVGVWALLGAALLRSLWKNRVSGAYGWLNLLVLVIAAVLAAAITVSGMRVRHGA